MTFGKNHVLEENDTSTQYNNGDFGRIFMWLDFDDMFRFKPVYSL